MTLGERIRDLARAALDAREDAEAAVPVPLEGFADGMAAALRAAIRDADMDRRAAAEPQGGQPAERQGETPKGEQTETEPTGDAQGGQAVEPQAEAREGTEQ